MCSSSLRKVSNEEIAESLAVAPKTVHNHVTNIYGRLAVGTRAQAIARSREAGYGSRQAEA